MKRVTWISLIAASAGVLTFALVTGSSAGNRGSSDAGGAETTLTMINQPVNETGFDINGDQELTPADGWVSNSDLLKHGQVVGHVASTCQYIQVRADGMGGVIQCVSTAQLSGGQIAIQSRIRLVEGQSKSVDSAITGGTGDYSTVRGYITSEPVPDSMNSKLTFHLMS